ncbi:MAG: acyl-CoA dehydrogenase family protein, partial [Candidatus Thermoplasmatota archaeon]|nr:acyl-CoA dehydrogenase family protein [Candidatus Thermoplasmatota archaeon]
MDFQLSEEQKQITKAAYELAKKEFPNYAHDCDVNETWPRELFDTLAQQGFIGVTIPEEYGGPGLGNLENALVMEQFGRMDGGLAVAMGASTFGSEMLREIGTEEQANHWLPKLAKGEAISGAAISEANAGSDVAAATCKAEKDGDAWVLNGQKYWITNATIADFLVVLAETDPDAESRHARHSIFLVECDRDGVTSNKITGKLGIRASPTAEVVLDDVRVPEENMLGDRGMGFKYVMQFFNETRIMVAAQGVGIAQGSVDRALDYSKERVQFNQPIAKFQGIQFKLAEMATKVECARMLTYKAAWLADQGRPDPQASSMAKWYSGETAVRVSDEAVQIHG